MTVEELIEVRRKDFEQQMRSVFEYEAQDLVWRKLQNSYAEYHVHVAFKMYCAALDGVVVELPKQYDIGGMACDGHDRAIAMCVEAIHAAGIKTKVGL